LKCGKTSITYPIRHSIALALKLYPFDRASGLCFSTFQQSPATSFLWI
jgi:hypothetical protein